MRVGWEQLFAAQQFAMQSAAGSGCETDREVDGVASEVDEFARSPHDHVDARRTFAEAMQARQQPAVGEAGERGDGQHAVGALGAQAGGRFAQQVESRGQFR